ncbi:MAG: SRPBCC domain-containing protein [Acidimicrobiia bacterium]|nr:SRPBCC domain-containing protein [Acidimicrobiia bacterium]
MPSADFERSLTVGRSPAECWSVLTDVQRVANWVTVVGTVGELEHLQAYTAVLEDQFGPFKLRADLDIQVTDLDEGNSIAFRAKGEDRAVSTSIVVDGTLALQPEESGTVIHVKGRWNVIGTVATMGSGTIRKKADAIMEEFFTAAQAEFNG